MQIIMPVYHIRIKNEKTHILSELFCLTRTRGWSGGAMVPGKLPVPGRPKNLDYRLG